MSNQDELLKYNLFYKVFDRLKDKALFDPTIATTQTYGDSDGYKRLVKLIEQEQPQVQQQTSEQENNTKEDDAAIVNIIEPSSPEPQSEPLFEFLDKKPFGIEKLANRVKQIIVKSKEPGNEELIPLEKVLVKKLTESNTSRRHNTFLMEYISQHADESVQSLNVVSDNESDDESKVQTPRDQVIKDLLNISELDSLKTRNDLGQSTLFLAAEKENSTAVESIINKLKELTVKTTREVEDTNGKKQTIEYYPEVENEINSSDSTGNTPLIVATQKGKIKIVKLLIDNGADINKSDRSGRTALFWAATRGNQKTVEFLLGENARVFTSQRRGRDDYFLPTPLLAAAGYKRYEILSRLLDNTDSKYIYNNAVQRMLQTTLVLFLNNNNMIDNNQGELKKEILKKILDKIKIPPIKLYGKNKNNILHYLLTADTDITDIVEGFLNKSERNTKVDIKTLLLDNYKKKNPRRLKSLLIRAVRTNNKDYINPILDRLNGDAIKNEKMKNGLTLLEYAISEYSFESAKELIKLGFMIKDNFVYGKIEELESFKTVLENSENAMDQEMIEDIDERIKELTEIQDFLIERELTGIIQEVDKIVSTKPEVETDNTTQPNEETKTELNKIIDAVETQAIVPGQTVAPSLDADINKEVTGIIDAVETQSIVPGQTVAPSLDADINKELTGIIDSFEKQADEPEKSDTPSLEAEINKEATQIIENIERQPVEPVTIIPSPKQTIIDEITAIISNIEKTQRPIVDLSNKDKDIQVPPSEEDKTKIKSIMQLVADKNSDLTELSSYITEQNVNQELDQVDGKKITLLGWACITLNKEAIDILLKKGANPNAGNPTALEILNKIKENYLKNDSGEVDELLTKIKNEQQLSLLDKSIKEIIINAGLESLTAYLTTEPSSINTIVDQGLSLLGIACVALNINAVKLLLDNGATSDDKIMAILKTYKETGDEKKQKAEEIESLINKQVPIRGQINSSENLEEIQQRHEREQEELTKDNGIVLDMLQKMGGLIEKLREEAKEANKRATAAEQAAKTPDSTPAALVSLTTDTQKISTKTSDDANALKTEIETLTNSLKTTASENADFLKKKQDLEKQIATLTTTLKESEIKFKKEIDDAARTQRADKRAEDAEQAQKAEIANLQKNIANLTAKTKELETEKSKVDASVKELQGKLEVLGKSAKNFFITGAPSKNNHLIDDSELEEQVKTLGQFNIGNVKRTLFFDTDKKSFTSDDTDKPVPPKPHAQAQAPLPKKERAAGSEYRSEPESESGSGTAVKNAAKSLVSGALEAGLAAAGTGTGKGTKKKEEPAETTDEFDEFKRIEDSDFENIKKSLEKI